MSTARTQKWRSENPDKYQESKDLWNKKRYPERYFLKRIGFDHKTNTIRKEAGKWLILHQDKIYTIVPCNCRAVDCEKMALVENTETMLNLHYNLMKISHILAPSSKCITKRLGD